jgi:septum formation protein
MRPLLLASTSPYRRDLLTRLGIGFEVVRPEVEEPHLEGEAPAIRARRLALAKARAVAAQRRDAVVIGSDQVAAAADGILDKPGDATRCSVQLERLSGSTAVFYTACAVIAFDGTPDHIHVDRTDVSFRVLSRAEIARYVERERPFDCAGGFKVEGLGISLFERVTTEDPTALIGLPLIWLAGTLRELGYEVP